MQEKSLKDIYDECEAHQKVPERDQPSTVEDKDDWNNEKAKNKLFSTAFDHTFYGRDVVYKDLSDIKVLEHGPNQYLQHERKHTGRRCLPFDWVSVHWTAKMDNLGHPKQVENSYSKRGEENPYMFQLGKYHTVKC